MGCTQSRERVESRGSEAAMNAPSDGHSRRRRNNSAKNQHHFGNQWKRTSGGNDDDDEEEEEESPLPPLSTSNLARHEDAERRYTAYFGNHNNDGSPTTGTACGSTTTAEANTDHWVEAAATRLLLAERREVGGARATKTKTPPHAACDDDDAYADDDGGSQGMSRSVATPPYAPSEGKRILRRSTKVTPPAPNNNNNNNNNNKESRTASQGTCDEALGDTTTFLTVLSSSMTPDALGRMNNNKHEQQQSQTNVAINKKDPNPLSPLGKMDPLRNYNRNGSLSPKPLPTAAGSTNTTTSAITRRPTNPTALIPNISPVKEDFYKHLAEERERLLLHMGGANTPQAMNNHTDQNNTTLEPRSLFFSPPTAEERAGRGERSTDASKPQPEDDHHLSRYLPRLQRSMSRGAAGVGANDTTTTLLANETTIIVSGDDVANDDDEPALSPHRHNVALTRRGKGGVASPSSEVNNSATMRSFVSTSTVFGSPLTSPIRGRIAVPYEPMGATTTATMTGPRASSSSLSPKARLQHLADRNRTAVSTNPLREDNNYNDNDDDALEMRRCRSTSFPTQRANNDGGNSSSTAYRSCGDGSAAPKEHKLGRWRRLTPSPHPQHSSHNHYNSHHRASPSPSSPSAANNAAPLRKHVSHKSHVEVVGDDGYSYKVALDDTVGGSEQHSSATPRARSTSASSSSGSVGGGNARSGSSAMIISPDYSRAMDATRRHRAATMIRAAAGGGSTTPATTKRTIPSRQQQKTSASPLPANASKFKQPPAAAKTTLATTTRVVANGAKSNGGSTSRGLSKSSQLTTTTSNADGKQPSRRSSESRKQQPPKNDANNPSSSSTSSSTATSSSSSSSSEDEVAAMVRQQSDLVEECVRIASAGPSAATTPRASSVGAPFPREVSRGRMSSSRTPQGTRFVADDPNESVSNASVIDGENNYRGSDTDYDDSAAANYQPPNATAASTTVLAKYVNGRTVIGTAVGDKLRNRRRSMMGNGW